MRGVCRCGDSATDAGKAAIKAGEVPKAWQDKPAKLRQKDRDARWAVKFSKVKPTADGAPQTAIAIPVFGCKSHVSIDRRHGVIRRARTTDAAAHDGARLREGLIDAANTTSDVWADTAYRSAANEAYLSKAGKRSRIHRKKPRGRAMPRALARANAVKSKIRARVEHVFAEQKHRMGLFVRTIGLARAEATITLANLAFNMKRWGWLEREAAPA